MAKVFEDVFAITKVDPDGKKFDKVSRLLGKSERLDVSMTLDVNSDIYPVAEAERLNVALAYTLDLDGAEDEGQYGRQTQAFVKGQAPSLMDSYDYVMCGKIFRVHDKREGGQVHAEVLVSFGGLILQLVAPPKNLDGLNLDRRIYLLARKV
ncbi:unnamed protein product [Pedinophyceae sp. YPF-701]|nr:unnamed protein product [Pedinophyceae sp. YPF-701]